jgi:hypothetical protein
MMAGQVWWCKSCGFEIKVNKACTGCVEEDKEECSDDCNDIECCGAPLEKKE